MKTDASIHCGIVLVGGGHAHVEVPKQFGMKPEPGVRLNLISPAALTTYSGMLPGYLAGHYTVEGTHIDLRVMCRFAGARFYQTAATGNGLVDRGL